MSDEFLINSYTGQWQEHPDVTRLADGSVVVVWDSFFFEDDLRVYYIAMQHLTAGGQRIGGEQVLAAFDHGQSTNPSVTALKDGGFAVGWEVAVGDSILDQTDVYTNAFDADGTARGTATRVQAGSREDQYAASVAATADGGYTLTWSSYNAKSENLEFDDIYTRTFDPRGEPGSRGRLVNQLTEFDQTNSRATTLSNGNVLLTWESEYAGDMTPSGVEEDAVRARLFTASGKPRSGEFLVVGENDGMAGGIGLTESSVDVAALSGGRFVVSWYQTVLHGKRDTTYEIHAQVYRSDGRKQGAEILVGGGTEGVPDHSAVTALEGGGFVVAWDAFGKQAYALEEIWARVFDDDGHALGRTFKINPPSGQSSQENPEIVALDDGAFMVVYESEYLDGDDDAIAGRIYDQGTFARDVATMRHTGVFRALGGDDAITGAAGGDELRLGRGDDAAWGGDGDDVIRGGPGADRLDGGAGADTFVYARAEASRADAADTLLAFESGRDRIDLSHVADFAWIGADAFSGRAGELRFADGVLAADLDGDARADFGIRVEGAGLVQADLIL